MIPLDEALRPKWLLSGVSGLGRCFRVGDFAMAPTNAILPAAGKRAAMDQPLDDRLPKRRASAGTCRKEERFHPVETTKASVLHYAVEARLSTFTVQAFAGGFLGAFAHSPKFAIRGISSEVSVDPEDPGSAVLRMEVPAGSLQLLDRVNDRDRREIERVMREEALEASTYPTVLFETSGITSTRTGDGQYSLTLQGPLSLHGVKRPMTIPARVVFMGDTLRAFGEFSLKQTDYRMKLVVVAGGVVKVKDELKFSFDLVARKQE
jgi:polyisoprenoid-binding protein YceI